MRKVILIPAAISSMRIAVLPFFFTLFNLQNATLSLALFAFAVSTDFLDGYAARKLKATSKFGAYYDAATDFILVLGIYGLFAINGLYPAWLPALIALSFIQFLVTSGLIEKIYDPIGRFIGSALYIGIILTLLIPSHATLIFVQYAFLAFFSLSLASRINSLTKNRRGKLS